jgi:hypothetical protein
VPHLKTRWQCRQTTGSDGPTLQQAGQSRSTPETIAGWDWNPGQVRGDTTAWRSSDAFDGEACALLVMRMTNGSFASYEGNNLATGKTNSWHGEYYRVECEGGAAVLDRDHIVRIEERSAAGTLQTREVPPVEIIWDGHQAVAAEFLD